MQRYWWPGYEIKLLGELQRQQNKAQFCDTLLQTEGISVPTHSCILAAFSPYLSQKLSGSLCPPSGQKRQLQLQAVKAQTLLKLVGLLYSGEVEVNGSIEQNDVLSAARQFGITDLVEGQIDGGMMEGEPQKKCCWSCGERSESRKMQDAQVQAEMAGRRATDCPVEKRTCVSTGTQTVTAGDKTVGGFFTHSCKTKPPTRELASPVAQSLDFSITLQPQNITLDKHLYSTCLAPAPSVPSGTPSDGGSTLDQSSYSVTKPTSTSALMMFPVSLNDDSNSLTPHDTSYQQSSEFRDKIRAKLDETTNAKTADKRENTEQSRHTNRDGIRGGDKGNSSEKKHAHAGTKNLAKMKQMQQVVETTQISIKVKLRRRTKGEVWEVVSMQDADETLSVLTSLKQVDLTNSEPSSVQPSPVHNPENLTAQPATTNSPEPTPPQPNTTSDSQLVCSDCFTPNQNDVLVSAPLAAPPGPIEDSDEQIEKLLEDIMMGLNILPNLERDCKKSHHLQPSHDGAIGHIPATENERAQSQMHAAVSAAGCVYYQDLGTQLGHSAKNTGIHRCSTAQNQSSCLSAAQSDVVLIQQQQCPPQYHSSVAFMGQRDGTNQQVMPLSESQHCPYTEAPTTRSVIPTAFYSSGKNPHHSACQEPSSQDDQNSLGFLPLTNGNEGQSLHSFSLPCLDDLRLPRCLSPLEPFTSAAKHQTVLHNSTNSSDGIQPQPSLHGRPWLIEKPGSLQFPLDAFTCTESVSLPQDTNQDCWSKPQQKYLEFNSPQNRGTRAESYTVEGGGAIRAGHQNAPEVKFDHRRTKEKLRCKQSDAKGDVAAPRRRKRKCSSHPQDAAGSLWAHEDVEVGDGTKSQITLSVCSVSLSSNNVLAKERQMATSSSNISNNFEQSAMTESKTETARGADQTRIRTRGFLKRSQEIPKQTNKSLENSSFLTPMACSATFVNQQGVTTPRRKRGRPPKAKLEETPAPISEKKSHSEESEQQVDSNLPMEEKTKKMCKKRRQNRNEVELIPLKKTISAGTAEVDDNNDVIPAERKLGIPKRLRMVSLKEFQKLIKRQHSKTRKSKESQDKEKNETARDVGSEEKACDLIKEAEMDAGITEAQSRDGIEESHIVFNVAVDKNHNQIFSKSTAEYSKSQRDKTSSSASEESSVFGEEHQLQNPDEARKACDAGVSDTTQQTTINDEDSSHTDTPTLPQRDKMDHNLNPQTPERTGPPAGVIKSSGCDQEDSEEEEEGEVEVDVLLYSPDKVPQSRGCENGLDNMDTSPEEEEEEDVTEIDVTGDEAE